MRNRPREQYDLLLTSRPIPDHGMLRRNEGACGPVGEPIMKTCVIVQTEIRHYRAQRKVTPLKPGDQALGTEETSFLNVLQKMIGRLTADFELRRDLMQECRFHLWRIRHKGEHPCQTRSWYLQN